MEALLLSDDKNTFLKNRSSRSNTLISGVMLLTVSTLICKIIGLFFKIPIINIVGIDGMAYFSSAYNIYMLLNSIAAAGLPVALSILISKNRAQGNILNIKKTLNWSIAIFMILGIAGTMFLFFGAESYSDIIGIQSSAPAVKAIAPTLFLICISGAIRGYFQGYEIMSPTAVSQVFESVGKLIFGVVFAYIAIEKGADSSYAAAAATFGLSVGVFISVVFLLLRFWFFSSKRHVIEKSNNNVVTDRTFKILTDLFIIAFPITVSSCVTSLTSLADTVLITNRLVSGGFSSDVAVALYSSYTNLAIPLFNLPPALITAIGISLIPALTAAITRRDDNNAKKIVASSIRLCNAFAIPAAAGLTVFSKQILEFIYPKESEACIFAAPLLSVLSIAIVFSCLTTVCNAILQSYMKTALPIISMAAGAIVKIIIEYYFVGTDLGIFGAPISTVACTFTILALDILFIFIYTPQRLELYSIWRTLLATVFGIGGSAFVYGILCKLDFSASISLVISIIVAVCLYAFFALLFGVVQYTDLSSFSPLKRLGDFLVRIKMIK